MSIRNSSVVKARKIKRCSTSMATRVQMEGKGIHRRAGLSMTAGLQWSIVHPSIYGDGIVAALLAGFLAIAKDIVKSHGGNIHVQSELGQGSVLTLELPLIKPEL